MKPLEQNSVPRQSERRRAPRYPFDAVLEMEWGSAVLQGRVRNISAGGMFVELDNPLWVGANFTARLSLDNPLRLDCGVRRVEPGRGMGLAFITPDRENQAQLANLLETLEKK